MKFILSIKDFYVKFEIHDKYFTVVGILDYTGSIFDNAVIIPLETAQDLYSVWGIRYPIFLPCLTREWMQRYFPSASS